MELAQALLNRDQPTQQRRALAKSITLIESALASHQQQAQTLLKAMLPESGKSLRIGISGTPGVGKSTFIEAFGLFLLSLGKRVAVLAVDPSSPIKGGSILGDKTRMENLSRKEGAFIRPSPSEGTLGGVANKTRESMILCEAAGYDVILVETVGVGQSEYDVASMVDFFLLLMQPGAGDDLQGIKRGIMELVDAIIINKADGTNTTQAKQSQGHYQNALHLMRHNEAWQPQVLCCSALENQGITEVWTMLINYFNQMQSNGSFVHKRERQDQDWMESLIQQMLRQRFEANPEIKRQLPLMKCALHNKELSPYEAAKRLIEQF
jgi:LAO/AO transport system kinase